MATQGTVRIDPRKLAALMRSPSGPVMRRAIVVADLLVEGAKSRVGYNVEKEPGLGSAGGGQHLRDTITKRFVPEGGGISIWIGSSSPIARLHHEGTKPHEIVPRNGRFLVFYWPKIGRVVFLKRVNHPGTKANRYLTDAAHALGLAVVPSGRSTSGFGFTL